MVNWALTGWAATGELDAGNWKNDESAALGSMSSRLPVDWTAAEVVLAFTDASRALGSGKSASGSPYNSSCSSGLNCMRGLSNG